MSTESDLPLTVFTEIFKVNINILSSSTYTIIYSCRKSKLTREIFIQITTVTKIIYYYTYEYRMDYFLLTCEPKNI